MALPRKFGSLFQPGTVERWLGSKAVLHGCAGAPGRIPLKPLLCPDRAQRQQSAAPCRRVAVIQKVADRGALSVVERVHLTAHGVWCHAVATGRAPRDITGDIRKALPVHLRKNYPAIVEPAALGELLRAMDGYKGGPVVRAALQLVPILFQRPAFFMPIPRRSLRTMPVLATGGGWPSSRPQVQQHAGHGQVT